jgi:acetolactate synthase-1/3 small subunit
MTIVVDGEESILEQIVKQLNRLVDVIKVIDFTGDDIVERELVIIRIDASRAERFEIIQLASLFNAKIASVTHNSITVEITGTKKTVEESIALLKPYGIKELVRSGTIAIAQRK